jgi:DGQHR domain-containing protein
MGHIPDQINSQSPHHKEELANSLSIYLGKKDSIFVQKTRMGETESYLGSVTLAWLADRVKFATQLPLFEEKFDPQTQNIIRDAQTIEELQQRPLDWSRQTDLVQYLLTKKHHKFPTVSVVITSPWINDPHSDGWDKKGLARFSVAGFEPLDREGNLGMLDLSSQFSLFALDGQHRLMGIQGLMELIRTGKLTKYDKNRLATSSVITVEDVLNNYPIDEVTLQNLPQEKIGIELISAVEKGESVSEARRRIRSIFVHVNLMAVSLTKGQLALLNEDNGFAIASRKIAVDHPLFREEKDRECRIDWDGANIGPKSTVLTTLQALQEMAQKYLGYGFPHWKPSQKGLIPLRPKDEEIEAGISLFTKLFDSMASLPSYKRLEDSKTPELRRFSYEKEAGEGNILFRPVGQIAVIQAIAILQFEKQLSLKEIFQKLYYYDQNGGFSGMEYVQSLWYGVLFNPNKKRIQISGKDLASKLLVYLIKGTEDELEKAKLRRGIALARRIGENQTINFQGKIVEFKDLVLPAPL